MRPHAFDHFIAIAKKIQMLQYYTLEIISPNNLPGFCLHHTERSLQGPPPPPPWSLRPHHCHANACIQTAR